MTTQHQTEAIRLPTMDNALVQRVFNSSTEEEKLSKGPFVAGGNRSFVNSGAERNRVSSHQKRLLRQSTTNFTEAKGKYQSEANRCRADWSRVCC
jgi:hypothetical protein